MSTSAKLGLAAILLFAISHFLPAYDTARGFSCFQECWRIMKELDLTNSGGWFYYSGFVLSNIAFLVLGTGLFVTRKRRSLRLFASLIILLHTTSWLFVNISGDISEIKAGYYVWLAAYGLLFAAHLTQEPDKSLEAVSPRLREAWEQIRAAAMHGAADAVSRLRCPTCGATLRIIFTPGHRTALGIRCTMCRASMHFAGEFASPPWVATLGQDIITS